MSRSCKDYGLACVTSTKLPFQATLSVHPSVCKYLQLYISMSDITVQLSPMRLSYLIELIVNQKSVPLFPYDDDVHACTIIHQILRNSVLEVLKCLFP